MKTMKKMNKPTETVCLFRYWEKGGRYGIECAKGLWSVEGPDFSKVVTEALRYFHQYKADREYTK